MRVDRVREMIERFFFYRDDDDVRRFDDSSRLGVVEIKIAFLWKRRGGVWVISTMSR